MKKVITIILNILKYCYLAILVIYIIFIGIHRISVDHSILGYRLYTINSTDMAPVYKINDIILVKDYNNSILKVGEDISYYGDCCGIDGMLIHHRIVRIDKDDVYTKGLNSPVEDPKINTKKVVGKIVGVVPFINLLHHILKSQIGFFLIIFCPLTITIVIKILQTITEIKLEKEELKEKNTETL